MSGNELVAWMGRNAVTVARLAAELHVTERTVYRWRAGEIEAPRAVELALMELEREL